jgi:aldehyde dehydrogenase (NAD(P)+)
MGGLFQEIKTPNGHTYQQPLGLFINNEIVQASSDQVIASIDPA